MGKAIGYDISRAASLKDERAEEGSGNVRWSRLDRADITVNGVERQLQSV